MRQGGSIPTKTRSLVTGLALALLAILLTLLALELYARAAHLGTGGFWEPHPLYGWRNIPGATGWESCFGECEVFVRINSKGLRDREFSYSRQPGAVRLLILGDSMTAGLQVPLEQTFAKVAEQRLNATGNAWEAINGGVNGFGTDNELLFFRLEGVKYDPDIVVLAVYLANDIYDNSRSLDVQPDGVSEKPYFILEEGGNLALMNYPATRAESLTIKIGSFLKKHFQLPRFLAQVLQLREGIPDLLHPLIALFSGEREAADRTSVSDPESSSGDICDVNYSQRIEYAWAVTRALLRKMKQEVEGEGRTFAVVALPAAPQIEIPLDGEPWYCDRANEELAVFLEGEGIPSLDLLQPFRDHHLRTDEQLYYERDFHMTPAGHQLAGELLAEFLFTLRDDPAVQVPATGTAGP